MIKRYIQKNLESKGWSPDSFSRNPKNYYCPIDFCFSDTYTSPILTVYRLLKSPMYTVITYLKHLLILVRNLHLNAINAVIAN